MDLGLSGRVAVVPGATSGLGAAVVRGLAGEGAHVAFGGRRAELAAELAAELPSAVGVGVDLLDPDGPRSLVDAATGAFGPVDVLVLNGGGPAPGTAAEMTAEDAEQAVHRLLTPHVRLVEQVLPGMRERGWGRIVAIGSSGVQQPINGLAASNVGRAALAGYLKTLATEVAADGVTVNLVLPGRIETERLTSINEAMAAHRGVAPDAVRDASRADIPAGRFGTPEEYAAAVVFLASAPASYITGAQLRCDGGLIRAH
ncbi:MULTISPECIES: SDR family oxidoreductase [unclassified Saccharopolyspora]|uniref:SDR family oxidoreductase n=1 Tax=unclassified Saccharopolyspora TaxID=2646250 RepID=UPI001CD2C57B|nr:MULTISPECIES: SDR family oxidoreductase [unclassified Saccharopolyspora]MCA1187370.1 SDR family oxidoreductase [Saccharopolyspora sp. 6T]MCA1194259.1 SDR family oxidoreductase [Saccharopolyspora sp. 6V]MCA1224778.1 SDR family oxidoreductase [Saccharopolyspora sp. 6M]MCA1280878.1 SDR family oxidoreductase [Saccharopolyspora sp. 7B]